MATMKEAMVNREDGASMAEQSCRWSRTLGSLDRVQLLRDLIYKHTRQRKSSANIPVAVHVLVGRREGELDCARYFRPLFNFLTLASNSVTRSRSAAHRNVT
jgi:hypothetical protein